MPMEKVFLNVAGFNLAFYFHGSKEPGVAEQHKAVFESGSEGFLTGEPERIDFEIEFRDRQRTDKDSGLLIQKNKIITFYQDNLWYKIILENALYRLVSRNSGVIVHSSSATRNNEAYLFLGASGAGKSTIIQLLNPTLSPINDDTSIVRITGGNILLYQHPIIEKNSYPKSSAPYTLKGVYFLKKSKNFSVKKLTDKDLIFTKLVKQLTVSDKTTVKNLLAFTNLFDEFFSLSFPKSKGKLTSYFESLWKITK